MIDRRAIIRTCFILSTLTAASLLAPVATAQQAFQRFIPFLVDLPGWQGEKPDGLSMESPGNSMITATREYRRDSAQVTAQIIVGTAAQGALAAAQSGMKLETSEGHMITSNIDGMPVTRTYTIKDKSGAIIVPLATSAMFSLSFNGVSENEAIALAKKYNWKAI